KPIEQARVLDGDNRLVCEKVVTSSILFSVKGSTFSFHKIKTPTRSSSETWHLVVFRVWMNTASLSGQTLLGFWVLREVHVPKCANEARDRSAGRLQGIGLTLIEQARLTAGTLEGWDQRRRPKALRTATK